MLVNSNYRYGGSINSSSVIEGYYNDSKFYEDTSFTIEITGESGKIYVDISTNKVYRWTGSDFIIITGNADTVDDMHASDFMPINGEVRKYGAIRMNATDGIRARHIDGNDSEFDGALYLNWNSPNAPIYMNGANTAIHSGNIGSQSVNYANSAGNADTVGGIQAVDFRQITKTSIQTLPTPPICEGDYFVSNGDSTFPYFYGNLSIRYGSYNGEFVAIYQTTGDDQNVWFNVYRGNWTGWRRIKDGGNADTVDNKHYTDFSQNAIITSIDQVNDSNLESGIYSVENVGMYFTSTVSSNWFMLIVNKHRNSPGYGTQIAIPYDGGVERGLFYRTCSAGSWQSWQEIITSENGVLTNALIAQSNTAYTTPQVRNATMSTSAPSGGSNGQIHFQYS